MATNTIKTRIVMRNDDKINWESSELSLLQGEIALAKNTDGTFEMRIGTGNKTWNELSSTGQLAIDAKNVIGLENELNKIHVPEVYTINNADTTKSVEEIINSSEISSATLAAGDVVIIKDSRGVASAYQYDKDMGLIACDGNVDASKVIFKDNISAMYTFGKYSGSITKPVSLNTVGKSVATLFSEALQEIKTPTTVKTAPSFAKQTYTTSITGEIGTIKTMPVFTAKFTDGAYEYGPSPTGSTIEIGNAFLSATHGSVKTKTNTAVLNDGGTISIPADTSISTVMTAQDQTNIWKWQLSATWTDGDKQWNSINIVSDTAPYITSGSKALETVNCTVKAGYYPTYELIKSSVWKDPNEITADDIVTAANNTTTAQNGFTKKVTGDAITDFKRTSFANVGTMQQWFWLAKTGKVTSIEVEQGNPVAPHTVNTRTIDLPIADGTTVEYTMFYINNPGATANNTFKVTVK